MKVGIILFSETGNTYSVAKKLKDNLKKHDVTIEKIEIERLSKDRNEFNITYSPSVKDYDIIVFGSFTEGFSLNPVMKLYLSHLELKDQKTLLFITHHFPFKWMGGTSCLQQLKNIVKEKEGLVLKTGIINWSSKKRGLEIIQLIDDFKQSII